MSNVNGHNVDYTFGNGVEEKISAIDSQSSGTAGASIATSLVDDGSVPGPSHNMFNGMP